MLLKLNVDAVVDTACLDWFLVLFSRVYSNVRVAFSKQYGFMGFAGSGAVYVRCG